MEKSEADVRQFLARFLPKLKTWGIIYLNRDKNIEALTQLAITASQRDSIIQSLRVEDYVETLESLMMGRSNYLWVFGKEIDCKEVYIKVAIGEPSSKTICISFHLAEYPLKYAFK